LTVASRQVEADGDLRVREALAEAGEHLRLALGQRLDQRPGPLPGDPVFAQASVSAATGALNDTEPIHCSDVREMGVVLS
jgi:hypothetical protein